MFPEAEPRETLRFEGNKINCFPKDQSLGTGHNVQEGVGRRNRILKGTVLVAHPSSSSK